MANTIATPTWVMKEVGRAYVNNLVIARNFKRTYDDQYVQSGAKVGDTVKARLPQRFTVTDGEAMQLQNLYDELVPITLTNQKHVAFSYSSAQATLDLDAIRERYVQPAAEALANAADVLAMKDVYASVYNSAVETIGQAPTDTFTYSAAGVRLTDMSAANDGRIAVIDPWAMATIADSVSTLFNPSGAISEAFKKNQFGRDVLGISEWDQSPNLPLHTTGTFTASTPLINGANQTGSTLITNGWASGASSLKKGDVFTIDGVFSVNRASYVSTGRLQQFVVTADTSDSGGAMATLPISPPIITSGALQTVSNSPANSSAITVVGATAATSGTLATTNSKQGMIWLPDAFAFVMADLKKPTAGATASSIRSKEWGIAIRWVEQYQILGDQNPSRLDILIGAAAVRPEWACRVWS
jgi:hypothetical protein